MVHVLVVVLLACAATRTVQSYDADAEDAPVLTVHKYCRIPRLKQMQTYNQEIDKPWKVAGTLVPTDISDSLFYKCNSSTDWKRATCFDGQWHPHIPTQCIDHTCYLDKTGEDKEPNTTAIIPCTGGYYNNRDYNLSMTCSSSGGYWFPPGCGEHMDAQRRGFTFDRIADQPLQPVTLTANAKSTIVLCPKGQELMRCTSTGTPIYECKPLNETFLLSSQDESPIMLSGLEITNSTDFTVIRNQKRLKCKDVDECKVIKWDNANSAADGKPQYLNERGILKCGDEASCENTECKDPNTCEGNDYQCKCRESWEFIEADRSCKFMARGECKQEVPEGVVRSAEDINKDLPDGCSLELKSADERARLGENDDVAEVKCEGRFNKVSFIDRIGKWGWKDGNCACPAYEYEKCPNQVYSNGQWWTVVQDGPIFGAQCWTEAYCGYGQKGICLGQCKPVMRTIYVLVDNPRYWFKWIPVKYPASCACYDCDGEPCNDRIFF